jgi:ribosomal protein S18 acetylase RimI-like enzyme
LSALKIRNQPECHNSSIAPIRRQVTIRRARLEDKEAIWRVHSSAIKGTCKSHYLPEQIQGWAGLHEPESYRELIQSKEFLVAEDDGLIVGFGQLNQQNGEVEAVYVSPDYGGLGVGSALLKQLEEVAQESGIASLHLLSSLNAVSFYERAGYIRGREAMHQLRNGIELALVYMDKKLRFRLT